MNDEDFDMLEAWRAGDARCGDRLLRRYHADVRRYVSRRAYRGVEDIVQSTFLAVVTDKAGYRGRGCFRGYLLGVARNQVHRYFRSQRRDRLVLGCEPQCVAHDPSDRVLLALSASRLGLALSDIDRELQTVVDLHYWQGLSTGQVADRLRIPRGTVKSRLRRARVALAARM